MSATVPTDTTTAGTATTAPTSATIFPRVVTLAWELLVPSGVPATDATPAVAELATTAAELQALEEGLGVTFVRRDGDEIAFDAGTGVVVVELSHDAYGPYGVADVALVGDTIEVVFGRYRNSAGECGASATSQAQAFIVDGLRAGAAPSAVVARIPSITQGE